MKTTATAVLLIVVACLRTEAQQVGRPAFEPSNSRRPLQNEWPVPSVLERGTSDLGVGRATLQGTFDESSQTSSARRSMLLDSVRRRLTITNQKRKVKYSEINERLDRLEGVLLRRKQPIPATPPPLSKMPEPTSPVDLVPPQKEEEPVEAKPESTPTPEVQPPQPEAVESTLPAPPKVVTDTAVDRIALADSLFASDQIEMALKLYFELSIEKLGSKDLIWANYQIACCSRRLKNLEQARKHYRIVAGQESDGLYPKLSRWWLDTIQRRVALQTKQQQITAALSATSNAMVTDAKSQ